VTKQGKFGPSLFPIVTAHRAAGKGKTHMGLGLLAHGGVEEWRFRGEGEIK